MLGRCPRSFLHRTSSKSELYTPSHEIAHIGSADDEKPVLQPPLQVVIGFDLGAESSSQACESPRSVLEPHHLCFRSHQLPSRSPLSPLSALGNLLSRNPLKDTCTEGAALCLKVVVEAEESAVDANTHHASSRRGVHFAKEADGAGAYCTSSKREHDIEGHSNANLQCACQSNANLQRDGVVFSRMNYVGARENQPWDDGCGNTHSKTYPRSAPGDANDEATDEVVDSGDADNPVSIFSTTSPVSSYSRCEFMGADFLSKCFLCRRRLVQGKDVYMYRGDRAFCSQECRYQQIVVDERKDRSPAAVTCVSGASIHHQRLRSATQAAVAHRICID